MRNAEVRAKLEELMIAVDRLYEETGMQRTDDHNENVRNMMMAENVEKRLCALEESAGKKERRLIGLEAQLAGTREHILIALEKGFDRVYENVNKECAETRRQMAELITMQQDRYNEILAETAEKRLGALEEMLLRIEAGTIERDLALRDKYNDILKELVTLKERLNGMAMEHVELKGMISATNRLIAELSEAKADEGNAHIADMKAVIAERLAGNEKTPLSTVELAELAEAAKKVAEAEEMTERRKAQRHRGAEFVF